MWYIHTIEYYSAINRKEILTYATMKLEDTTLSERSHHTKGQILYGSTCMGTYSGQIHRDRKWNGGYQRLGVGRNGE